METLFRQFVKERVYLKNVTLKTESWYWDSWRSLGKPVFGDQSVSLPPKDRWLTQTATLRDRGVSATSVNTYARAINAFLRWGHEEGHFAELVRIPRLKQEQKTLATFNSSDLKKLVDYKPRNALGTARLHTLSLLLLDTGLRIDEALGLSRQDIDLDNLLVKVKGKGSKERVVPMSLDMRKVLFRWLSKHHHNLAFPTRNGGKLGQRNLLRDFKQLNGHLGIKGVRCSFHTLRHTFAVGYIRNGGDPFRLQRILGHSSLEMTRRYVNLQTADQQAVHQRSSPLAGART